MILVAYSIELLAYMSCYVDRHLAELCHYANCLITTCNEASDADNVRRLDCTPLVDGSIGTVGQHLAEHRQMAEKELDYLRSTRICMQMDHARVVEVSPVPGDQCDHCGIHQDIVGP